MDEMHLVLLLVEDEPCFLGGRQFVGPDCGLEGLGLFHQAMQQIGMFILPGLAGEENSKEPVWVSD